MSLNESEYHHILGLKLYQLVKIINNNNIYEIKNHITIDTDDIFIYFLILKSNLSLK